MKNIKFWNRLKTTSGLYRVDVFSIDSNFLLSDCHSFRRKVFDNCELHEDFCSNLNFKTYTLIEYDGSKIKAKSVDTGENIPIVFIKRHGNTYDVDLKQALNMKKTYCVVYLIDINIFYDKKQGFIDSNRYLYNNMTVYQQFQPAKNLYNYTNNVFEKKYKIHMLGADWARKSIKELEEESSKLYDDYCNSIPSNMYSQIKPKDSAKIKVYKKLYSKKD